MLAVLKTRNRLNVTVQTADGDEGHGPLSLLGAVKTRPSVTSIAVHLLRSLPDSGKRFSIFPMSAPHPTCSISSVWETTGRASFYPEVRFFASTQRSAGVAFHIGAHASC